MTLAEVARDCAIPRGSKLTQNSQKSFLGILSVPNRDHEDQQDIVLDLT